jgi:predicted MFS family arabinose efflux permease
VIGDIRQGFRWLMSDRRAGVTVLLMAMTSMVAQALILMFLVEAHSKQLSTVAVGIVLAASGAGGAVGSFFSRIVPSKMRSFWLPIQMVTWSVALAFLAIVGGQSVYLSASAMFILGLTGAIGNVEFGTYLVRNVADDMIAKITGIGQMLAIGACALGPVLGGYATQQFQVQGAMWILLAIVFSLAFFSLLLPGTSGQFSGALRVIKQFMRGRGHPVRGAVKVVRFESTRPANARAEQDRDGELGVIAGSDQALLRKGNGRLSSSIDQKALICEDAGV